MTPSPRKKRQLAVAPLNHDTKQILILPQAAAKIPWLHTVILIEKVKTRPACLWYMQRTIQHGWSRSSLGLMIRKCAPERQGQPKLSTMLRVLYVDRANLFFENHLLKLIDDLSEALAA